MTRYKKMILLFLALLFPVCIFLFLKIFGKNEFAVPALYTDVYPEAMKECGVSASLPYQVADSVMASLSLSRERLTLIHLGQLTADTERNLKKVTIEHEDKINFKSMETSGSVSRLRKCIFFLKEPYDVVLVDGEGTIRGEYISDDRDEIDRLRMELSILFKEY